MKQITAILLGLFAVCQLTADPGDDLAVRAKDANERLAKVVRDVMSIDVGDPRSAELGKLSGSFDEDSKILAAATALFARKGVKAWFHPEESAMIVSVSTSDEFSTYSLSLMWFYRNREFERFGASRSVQGREKPNQSLEPTPPAGTSAAEQPLVPAAGVAHL